MRSRTLGKLPLPSISLNLHSIESWLVSIVSWKQAPTLLCCLQAAMQLPLCVDVLRFMSIAEGAHSPRRPARAVLVLAVKLASVSHAAVSGQVSLLRRESDSGHCLLAGTTLHNQTKCTTLSIRVWLSRHWAESRLLTQRHICAGAPCRCRPETLPFPFEHSPASFCGRSAPPLSVGAHLQHATLTAYPCMPNLATPH